MMSKIINVSLEPVDPQSYRPHRKDVWVATLVKEGVEVISAKGYSSIEAIGNLVHCNQEEFGVTFPK